MQGELSPEMFGWYVPFKYYTDNGEIAKIHYEKAVENGKVQVPAKVLFLVTITMSAADVLGHIYKGTMDYDKKYEGFRFFKS